ncbi:MAG: DUF4838 domain-containing protein [Oscillospiraceae bacterium]|nr:DUF4838 domain-containing protein [Oscillospiraceae bacterium]
MLTINKLHCDSAIDHAALELKKYLRMMMPEAGEVEIFYNPEAKDGFRLGFLEDFGVPFTGEKQELDDEIYIETDVNGGIIAGSNPRSVLFAVYRYLRENGCRWLYPGIDGDYVPMQDIVPVSYHKLADHRIRGFCDEGYTSQTTMLEAIDYYAKLEMNTLNLEFFIPMNYYTRYYSHYHNEENRMPEPVDEKQVLQWRRQCEVELAKRGFRVTGIGHGWTSRAFGFKENPDLDPSAEIQNEADFPQETIDMLALVKGKRKFFTGRPPYTQLCLSKPIVRTRIADAFVDYAKNHQNYKRIAFSFSDGSRNYCECEECVKMRPSDWRNMILNEIDEKLTEAGLDTQIGFSMYVDTLFAPQHIKLNNPDRFVMSYCPITRDYTTSITEDTVVPEPLPYIVNGWKTPTTEEGYALLKEWQKVFKGDIFCYDYHFWRNQYMDPGGYALAKRIYEDVRSLKIMGLCGMVEDGSQRSYFPNGFPVYIYAETLMNRDADFEAVRADYFEHIYGQDWQKVDTLLRDASNAFDFAYMEGVRSIDEDVSLYYDPKRVARLNAAHDVASRLRFLFKTHHVMPNRPQTVSWRLINRYTEWLDWLADIVKQKAVGNDWKARELSLQFATDFGKYEIEMERYYDHGLCAHHTTAFLCRTKANAKKIIVE